MFSLTSWRIYTKTTAAKYTFCRAFCHWRAPAFVWGTMRIAFAIVSLFPGGGLQRDCVEIAKLVRGLGHEVTIYTCRLHDHALADDIPILLLQNDAGTNHGRQYAFAVDFLKEASDHHDLIVGFDKLFGLDVLYCADPSMAYRLLRQPYLRLLPRYWTYHAIEKDSFAPPNKTKIILLSHGQMSEYWSAWGTEASRMNVVPPTLTLDRRQPDCRTNGVRQTLRSQLGLANDDLVWISICVQPLTKGIDRVIRALAKFPDVKLVIAGLNETNRSSAKQAKLARDLGVASRVKWLGHREDVPHLMSAADLMVHPARYDTTGTVILEAIINGLPVITTAACGYARHVESADAGVVLREPFEFRLFLAALEEAQDPAVREAWSTAGKEYGHNPALYQGRLRAAEAIVDAAHSKVQTLSREAFAALVPAKAVGEGDVFAAPIAPITGETPRTKATAKILSMKK
jgi:UDP-glucose:(heptosyl)LPS alpha-1,3-glucosyltransferase